MSPTKSKVKKVGKIDKSKSSQPSASEERSDAVCRRPKEKIVGATASKNQFTTSAISSRGSPLAYTVPVLHLDRSQSALMEHYGNHPLHMDALQGNMREIEYHHRRGLLPDCHNLENSTPLMFACLFGQRHAARMLLEAGASKKAQDIFGHSALDYTMDCRCMNQRRQLYSFVRKDELRTDCRVVADSLGPSSETHQCATAHHPTSRHKNYFSLQMSGQTVSVTVPMARLKVPSPFPKAIGFILQSGNLGMLSSAVSGWRRLDPENPPSTLDNSFYTREVMRISKQWKHDLPWHQWDSNSDDSKPGQYRASHAEKKLIVHYICRLLLQEFGEKDTRQLHRLKEVAFGQEVPIHLNMKPCANCRDFALKAEEVTGIRFVFEIINNWTLQKCDATDNIRDGQDGLDELEDESSADDNAAEETITKVMDSQVAAVVVKGKLKNSLPDRAGLTISQTGSRDLDVSVDRKPLNKGKPQLIPAPAKKRKAKSKPLNHPITTKRVRLSPAIESASSAFRKLLDERIDSYSSITTKHRKLYAKIGESITTSKKDAARKSIHSLLGDSLDSLDFHIPHKPSVMTSTLKSLDLYQRVKRKQ